MSGLAAQPPPVRLRPGEVLVWQGQPCWRTLAGEAFHIRAITLWVCALLFANAVAARWAHLPPFEAMRDILPLAVLGALVVGAVAAAAWASGRTTRYTITSQRIVLQYGVALTATLSIPMRVIGCVAVSDGPAGDVPVRLKPGHVISYLKLWPHARPWRVRRPEPMLRALPEAAKVAALLSRTVAAAQAAGTAHTVAVPSGAYVPAQRAPAEAVAG